MQTNHCKCDLLLTDVLNTLPVGEELLLAEAKHVRNIMPLDYMIVGVGLIHDSRKLIAEQPSQNTRSNFNISKNVSSEQQQQNKKTEHQYKTAITDNV